MKFMSINEVAKTGLISEAYLRNMVKEGECPCIKSGNKVLVNFDALVEKLDKMSRGEIGDIAVAKWEITHDFDDNSEAMRPLGRVIRCSICGYTTGHAATRYCPYCGRRMRDYHEQQTQR